MVMCRAWACWSVAMNSQKGQGMWATRIRLWCWWFWFAIQKPRSFHDPMVSTWDFGGLQFVCRLCTLGRSCFSNLALKCSPLAAWMLDNCRQIFVVLIWVHACTDRVFGILSIVFDSAFGLSFMTHWPSANFMLDDVAPL